MRYAAGFTAAITMFLWTVVSHGEPGFDPRYERDYNIFNPVTKYQSDNPLNPVNKYDPDNAFNPVNQYDPGNPTNPINHYNPNNPFNPVNRYRPDNPLNPVNKFNPAVPFAPLDGGKQAMQLSRQGSCRGLRRDAPYPSGSPDRIEVKCILRSLFIQ